MNDRLDGDARVDALDPERSFIVEAPAGSGKTELLIQRYLTLLLRVDEPEQVIAVTFTRKAAAEMRARVLGILRIANEGGRTVEAHRARTLGLATAVLDHDARHEWALLDRPGRVRIDTVDALNAWLADRLPVLAGAVAGGAVVEDPGALYDRVAARAVQASLTESALRPHARRMLESSDNSMELLIRAVSAVLPLRDQWVELLAEADADALHDHLAGCMERLVRDRLLSLVTSLGPELISRIESLLRHAGAHSDRYRDVLSERDSLETVSGADPASQLAAWQAAAGLLLTGTGKWRQRFTRADGFLPSHQEQKKNLGELITALAEVRGTDRKLVALRLLPPLTVSDAQLERAIAARELLRRAVAELKLCFQTEGVVDFLELALGAQHALGSVDAPSDLLLALDRRIEHVLVDEFQDTSHSQYRLLELLTAGWSEGDGRTLFLVGDPMQSIYRFRNADMALFLRARHSGIGSVRLHRLTLARNFRSAPAVVDWVNATFANVFPFRDDPESGAPRYSPFSATLECRADDGVMLHRIPAPDVESQHRCVARIAADELDATEQKSVAVLVQSRSHLAGLREALRDHGIRTRAVELDTLAEQPVVQDLLALTRALLHFEDRIAWLALLRGPWCGLTWSELHALASPEDGRSVRDLLDDSQRLARIEDPDSRQRIEWLRARLTLGCDLRGRYPLARWIECCWQLLDGPACLTRPEDLDLVRQYLTKLASIVVDGDIDDPAVLDRAFAVPFEAERAPAEGHPLEIMTIHRAKGLEFDTVILFGLERRVRSGEAKAIYWQETPSGLLYAPISTKPDPLADYLRGIDRELDQSERARLLYVAVTRARRRLHLIGYLADPGEGQSVSIPAGSLMSFLSDQFAATAHAAGSNATAHSADRPDCLVPGTVRLETAHPVPLGPLASTLPPPGRQRTTYDWARPAAAQIGTVVHRALQKAGSGAVAEIKSRLGLDAPGDDHFGRALELLGIPRHELADAATRVRETLERVLADETGAWILSAHEAAESELELTVSQSGELAHVRLDRTFIDADGIRWIIDYKTSRHSGGNVEDFLDSEVERYRDQLEAYADAMHEIENRPIRVGLYFPLLAALRDWVPAVCTNC